MAQVDPEQRRAASRGRISAPRRMVPSPPSTTTSSLPSSGRRRLRQRSDCSASRGSIAAVLGRRGPTTIPAVAQPFDQPVAAPTAAGRPVWVSTATRRLRALRATSRAAPGHVTGPAYPTAALRRREQQEVLHVPRRPRQRARPHGAPRPAAALPRPRRPRGPRPRRAQAVARTTPPGPSRSLPTSNCGLTISTRSPSAAVTAEQRLRAPGEGDERQVGHHQVDRSPVHVRRSAPGRWSGRRRRTRGSVRSGRASWPCPTSTATTCRQPALAAAPR